MLEEFRRTSIVWDKASKKTNECLRVSQSDNGGRSLFVTIINGNRIENLVGATLSLYWETKDKLYTGLDIFEEVDASKGEFEIKFTTDMLSHKGTLHTNLVLVDRTGRVVSETIPITVFEGIDESAVQSDDRFSLLTQALVKIGNITYEMGNFALKKELQQVSITYKESFATISELQANYPNGDVYNHVVLEDGLIYTYRDAWISTGINALGSGVADGTIGMEKTTFMVPSANLFNKDDSKNIDGKYLNFAVSPASQPTLAEAGISHPIKVTPGQKYVSIFDTSFFGTGNAKAALYDKNGNYIDRSTPVVTGRIGVLTMPTIYPQLDHIRINYRQGDKPNLMLLKSDSYPSSYIPFLSKMTENIILNETQLKQVDERIPKASPLFGGTLSSVGDSIMEAKNESKGGWPGRMAKKYGMSYTNRGISGAVFARGVKTSGGADVPCILNQISNHVSSDVNWFEGGTNDADYNVPMGTISTGFNATLDESTFCGAFESACKQMIIKCHGKKILYIVAQKMGTVSWQNRRYPYFSKAMEICKKWGVPFVNLWDDFYINPAVDILNTTYYKDTQHLLPEGYDVTFSTIENKTLEL